MLNFRTSTFVNLVTGLSELNYGLLYPLVFVDNDIIGIARAKGRVTGWCNAAK